jgi:hypothetical protein
MKTFKIRFNAKRRGALGTLSGFERFVNAESEDLARLKLYDNFDHVEIASIAEAPREVVKVLACPYCGDAKSFEALGCCGESNAHFEEVYRFDDAEGDDATLEDFEAFRKAIK